MSSATARVRAITQDLELSDDYPETVWEETRALQREPGFDDPALVDDTSRPYVTIDGPTSRDLDQAVCVERSGEHLVVRYAIADVAHFVRRRTALYGECLRRGASYYLPGHAVPMLPRPLSEDLVSLRAGVVRRALVFVSTLDQNGDLRGTELVRARIRSRAKLSFGEVQTFLDREHDHDHRPEPGTSADAPSYAESLRLLRVVGEARIADMKRRDVVRYDRREVEFSIDQRLDRFVVSVEKRKAIEQYNEHLSLLCNGEGARILNENPAKHVQPIYRVHPAPARERLEQLATTIDGLCALHRLPDSFHFRREPNGSHEPLAGYVARLPDTGPYERVARAIERHAILVNQRSVYTTRAGIHFGVGAEPYARFSAPMREVVGVFVHTEMQELLHGAGEDDEDLREAVVQSANASKDMQRRVDDAVRIAVLDQVFGQALERNEPPVDVTIMGATPTKVHVQVDESGLELKVYAKDLGPDVVIQPELSVRGPRHDLRVGDHARLIVREKASDGRWVLDLLPAPTG
jgi:ribonuclease R